MTMKKAFFSFCHQFIGNDLTQKRDIHGAMVDNRLKHFADNKNVYTRKNFYRILEQQINSYGYNGTSCLLRAICETAETPFHEYNGVFGNIFHILFRWGVIVFNRIVTILNILLFLIFKIPFFSNDENDCSPSSSKAENIRPIYYKAEYHGHLQECHRYTEDCNTSFLDLISNMISVRARNMM